VGGAVRDKYLGSETHDWDLIVVDEDAKIFTRKLESLFEGTFVPLDEANKIFRVVLPDKINYIDVTNPVEGSLEKDLLRRDLTMNAVAINLKTGETLDLYGGVADIKNKTIRHISDTNFEDDPLRLLRVYRFQAQSGFEISPDTVAAVCKYCNLIRKPAAERVCYELLKLFSGEFAHKALIDMDKTRLLEEIFPFVKELKQIPPNTHHHLDLFHHSVEVIRQIQCLYENSRAEVKTHLDETAFGGFSRLAHLKLAGFLHDIGKFSTWTVEGGRHRFVKHDDVGAKLAAQLLKKMKFSNKQSAYVSELVKNHLYPAQLMSGADVSEKSMTRFIRKMGDKSVEAILLSQADRLSARGAEITDTMVEENIAALNRLLDFYFETQNTAEPLPKLLSGDEVMELTGLKPSAELGKTMLALHEAQLSGEVNTRDEAVKFVQGFKS
jgi:tRNA nucleotidyltransferase/poly(A) polymerase